MKKVLEVFGEPISRGGQESYVMNALTNMNLSDLHIDMFTPYYCDNEAYKYFIESHGGKVNQGGMPFVVGGSRREIVPVFEEYLKDKEYDVVHIHSGSISVLAYYARIASKVGVRKVIVHSHSSGVKENIKHFLIKKYASRLFEAYATDYFACSLEAAKWKYPMSVMSKVKVLKNGVDLLKFKYDEKIRKKFRNEYKIADGTLVLGHVGRFTYEKNQIFLIDVLLAFRKKYSNKKAILMLIGDGEELASVKKKVDQLGMNDSVIFTGARDNINEYMQMFDIFLFPSLYEGLGMVGIEAQAAGLPVIASKGIPQLMKVKEQVVFVDLAEIDKWVLEIYKKMNMRDISQDEIKSKGFDIIDTSRELRNIYFEE